MIYWSIYSLFRLLRFAPLTIEGVCYPLLRVEETMIPLLTANLATARELSAIWRVEGNEKVFKRK